MTIKKFTGKTKEEAIAAAKAELGPSLVIMNTRNMKPEGIMGIFKQSIWEVTAAIEDETDGSVTMRRPEAAPLPNSTFSVAADESITVPPIEHVVRPAPKPAPAQPPVNNEDKIRQLTEEEVKSTFREISEVLSRAEDNNSLMAPKQEKNIIKATDIVEKKKEENIPPKKEPEIIRPQEPAPQKEKSNTSKNTGNLPVVRMVYNKLMGNEVDEKYINQIFDDMGNILQNAGSLDYLISNIYQKMVLKLGTPSPITIPKKGPLVVFFVGPTGVGKTTTIAKIASRFKVDEKLKVAFITSDTYRIGATEQLNTYAEILDAPISVIYGPEELTPAVEGFRDQDLVLVDTVGFSHKNDSQRDATGELLSALDGKYKKSVYLVLSVTTKYKDLKEICKTYRDFCDYDLIFTKLDETDHYGNILNIKLFTGAGLSYVTTGQTVPDDIEVIDPQKIVKTILGGA